MENIKFCFSIQKEGNPNNIRCYVIRNMVIAFENKNIEEIIENNQNGFIFNDFKDLLLLNKIINKELFELTSKNARETINQITFESAITRELRYL